MRNMSDIIEKYLKEMIEKSGNEVVEIKRAHIAEKFDCVPSQLNYVIKTRFTNEHGYAIESKRGGGGYIRISKVETNSQSAFIRHLIDLVGDEISQANAFRIVDGLYENKLITDREKKMIIQSIHRDTLQIEIPFRDIIRANILKRILAVIHYN